jgi:hypothetical protein
MFGTQVAEASDGANRIIAALTHLCDMHGQEVEPVLALRQCRGFEPPVYRSSRDVLRELHDTRGRPFRPPSQGDRTFSFLSSPKRRIHNLVSWQQHDLAFTAAPVSGFAMLGELIQALQTLVRKLLTGWGSRSRG